jgi:arylsulfatase
MVLTWPQSWSESQVKIKRGSTNDRVVEIRDLLPTFLDIAGAYPPPPSVQMDGKPMTCLITKDPTGTQCGWRQWIDMEQNIIYNDTIHWNALTDGNQKYIFNAWDATEMFFDLVKDPQELHNVIHDGKYATIIAQWRQRLIDQFTREQRGDKWLKNGVLQARKTSTLYSPNYPGKCRPLMHRQLLLEELVYVT